MPKDENDNRSLGDKIEDGMEDAVGTIEDFFYGEEHDFNNDIPATMETGKGYRKVNKIQTRKNINKRIVHNRVIIKIVIIILSIAALVFLIRWIINYLLMS